MYSISTDKIHANILSADESIKRILNNSNKQYSTHHHLHRNICRTTYRAKDNNRLLATIDIMKWDKTETPNTPEFNHIKQSQQEYVSIFYTTIW